jgi:mycoredoxin
MSITDRERTEMLTMYSTPWCIAYQVIDIEADEAAATFVMSINGGNQTVPTVRFDDGTTLTNPTIVQVKQQLTVV